MNIAWAIFDFINLLALVYCPLRVPTAHQTSLLLAILIYSHLPTSTSSPDKHVDLSRLIATNKEPPTIVKSHTHRPKAIVWTFLDISVREDVENRSGADA